MYVAVLQGNQTPVQIILQAVGQADPGIPDHNLHHQVGPAQDIIIGQEVVAAPIADQVAVRDLILIVPVAITEALAAQAEVTLAGQEVQVVHQDLVLAAVTIEVVHQDPALAAEVAADQEVAQVNHAEGTDLG